MRINLIDRGKTGECDFSHWVESKSNRKKNERMNTNLYIKPTLHFFHSMIHPKFPIFISFMYEHTFRFRHTSLRWAFHRGWVRFIDVVKG